MAIPHDLRPATAADGEALAALEAELFAGRAGRAAALLRRGARPFAPGCLVAGPPGSIAGSVACHHMLWTPARGAPRPLIWLGPLMVRRELQGRGLGRRLTAAALAAADARALPVSLVGDEDYYGAFGFVSGPGALWTLPGPVEPDRVLLRAADPARWAEPARISPMPTRAAA